MTTPEKHKFNYHGREIQCFRIKTSFGVLAGTSPEDVTDYKSEIEALSPASNIFNGNASSPALSEKMQQIKNTVKAPQKDTLSVPIWSPAG